MSTEENVGSSGKLNNNNNGITIPSFSSTMTSSPISININDDTPRRLSSLMSVRRIVSESVADLSNKEEPARVQQLIKSLAEKIKQSKELENLERTDKFFLRRFIRGCKYDVDKAFIKISAYHEFRTKGGINFQSMNASSLRQILQTGAFCLLPTYDKKGRIILYLNLGALDFDTFTTNDWIRAFVYVIEKALDDENAQINGITCVCQLENFGMGNFNLEAAKMLVDILQNRYPIRLGHSWMIRESKFVDAIWVIFKTILSKKTKDRMHFLGDNVNILKEAIDPASLPEEIGGEFKFDIKQWIVRRIEEECESFIIKTDKIDGGFTGIDFLYMAKDIHVTKVKENTIAEKVGLKIGDVIVSTNGQKVHPYELKKISMKDPLTLDLRRTCRDLWGRRIDHKYQSVKDLAVASDQNVRWRRAMEDRHVVEDKFGGVQDQIFMAVYDGHGGKETADFVASNLHTTFLKELEQSETEHESFISAYQKTDQQTLEANGGNSGSTSVTVLIRTKPDGSRWLYCANIGDSRAILCRNGQAVRLSYDHKAVDEAERARVKQTECFIIGGKIGGILSVSRSFGDKDLKKWVIPVPHFAEVKLQDGDSHVIIACDGLWDVVSDGEVATMISSEMNAALIANKLLARALRGSKDNISIIVAVL